MTPKVADQYAQVFNEAWQDKVNVKSFRASKLATQKFSFTSKDTPQTEITFSPHDQDFADQILNDMATRIQQEGKSKQEGSVLFAVMEMDNGKSPVYTKQYIVLCPLLVRLVFAGLHALAQGLRFLAPQSIAAGAEPRGTISTIGCSLYSNASVWVASPPPWAASLTSFSPTCRLSLKRPRTRLPQTISALRRAFSVSGRTPWLSRDLVSCSGDSRIRWLMPA